MTDDLTWHVDQPCPSPVSVSHVPLAKMSISKHTHGVGGIWHEKGSPYRPRPLRVCVWQVLAAGLLSTPGNALGFLGRAHHAFPDQSCPHLLTIGAENNPKSN